MKIVLLFFEVWNMWKRKKNYPEKSVNIKIRESYRRLQMLASMTGEIIVYQQGHGQMMDMSSFVIYCIFLHFCLEAMSYGQYCKSIIYWTITWIMDFHQISLLWTWPSIHIPTVSCAWPGFCLYFIRLTQIFQLSDYLATKTVCKSWNFRIIAFPKTVSKHN